MKVTAGCNRPLLAALVVGSLLAQGLLGGVLHGFLHLHAHADAPCPHEVAHGAHVHGHHHAASGSCHHHGHAHLPCGGHHDDSRPHRVPCSDDHGHDHGQCGLHSSPLRKPKLVQVDWMIERDVGVLHPLPGPRFDTRRYSAPVAPPHLAGLRTTLLLI